ncbi:MAG: SGNH/GDSL hydrolase family protein [Clostridia bacterium]|nr:SGNH/GDSL hydrolase family protein [Clostridia bacterium]
MNLEGKVINILGDSITEGSGVSDIENCRYDNRLKALLGLKAVNNYGIGGTRLAHQTIPSEKPRYDQCFCGRAYEMDKNADAVVVYGGVNDYLHGDAPIGSEGDKTPATFYGAVYFLMNFLKENYPDKPIVFMTPAHCYRVDYGHDYEPSTNYKKKPDALPLKGYVDIIEQMGAKMGIPVLNLYDKLGINPNEPDDSAKYTTDGLHFNDLGHEFIAELLADFLKTI